MFLALGFLLMAIGGALIYYLANFELPMFIITAMITGLTIFFIFFNYTGYRDFFLIAIGTTIYGLLNILGKGIQIIDISLISMSIPAIVFLCIMMIQMVNRDLKFD